MANGADTFAARLRSLREKAGLTQEQLATAAGLKRLAVVRLEAGARRPTFDTVQALAAALGKKLRAFEGCL